MVDEADRQAFLDALNQHFEVTLLWNKPFSIPTWRDDVTTHFFFDPENKVTDAMRRDIRRWVGHEGWQWSRQYYKVESIPDPVEYIFLAPEQRAEVTVGYHATRQLSVPFIMVDGLLPSTADRQTSHGRHDCEGNIYLVQRLGGPADIKVHASKSAYWWRGHLADNNRFGDRDWVILRVEVGKMAGVRACRDMWSESGIVLDNVEKIPPDLISLEYPSPNGDAVRDAQFVPDTFPPRDY